MAQTFLSSLYACLDECVGNIARSLGRYNISTHEHQFPPNVFVGVFGGLNAKSIEILQQFREMLEALAARGEKITCLGLARYNRTV